MPTTPTKVLILPGRPLSSVKTHTLDCKWAAGYTTPTRSTKLSRVDYVEVEAASLPDEVGRCSRCGGGR